MKNLIFIFSCIVFSPIILVHELLHIIVGEILREGYTNFRIFRNKNILAVGLSNRETCYIPQWKRILMSYAPLLMPITIILLSFFFTEFISVLLYFIVVNILYKLISGSFIGLFLSYSDIEYGKKGISIEEHDRIVEESLNKI